MTTEIISHGDQVLKLQCLMAIVLNHQLSINDRFFRMYLDYPVLFHFFVHLHQKTTFEEYATQVFTGRMSYLSAYRLRQSASH